MKFFNKYCVLGALAVGVTLIPNAAHAKEPVNLLTLTAAATSPAEKVSHFDKQAALAFIELRLMEVDPGCAAFDYYLDTRDSILEGDYVPSAVREMAALYRNNKPQVDIIAEIIKASEDEQVKKASDAVFAASFALAFAK